MSLGVLLYLLQTYTVILKGGRIGLWTANQLGCVQLQVTESSSQRALNSEATWCPPWQEICPKAGSMVGSFRGSRTTALGTQTLSYCDCHLHPQLLLVPRELLQLRASHPHTCMTEQEGRQ